MPTTQQRFDWEGASLKEASLARRKLLTRLAMALQGRSLGDPAFPRSLISGATLDQVLQGLHGWCVSTGMTDRRVGELCPALKEPTVRRALAYLQSPDAELCVAVDPFRAYNSPRNNRWICWPNLEAWVERLEADPVPVRTAKKRGSKTESTRSERAGHPLGASGSTRSERAGHPLGASGSYKEDGTLTEQTAPPMEPEAAEGGGFDSVISEFTTEAPRHGGGIGGVDGDTPLALGGAAGGPQGNERPKAGSIPAQTDRSNRSQSPSVPLCLRGESVPPRSTLHAQRRELEQLLGQRLGIEAPVVCLDIALRHQTLDQVEAVIQYAISQEVDGVRPWGPGFVFTRLSRAPSTPLAASEGWTKRSDAWRAAQARRVERERSERAEQRQRAERDLRTRRAEVEAHYGPLIDELIEEDPQRLLAALSVSDRTLARSFGLRDRGIRDSLLIAAMQGRLCEEVSA